MKEYIFQELTWFSKWQDYRVFKSLAVEPKCLGTNPRLCHLRPRTNYFTSLCASVSSSAIRADDSHHSYFRGLSVRII